MTGMSIWAESHAAIHTWDEDNYYAVRRVQLQGFPAQGRPAPPLDSLRYRGAQLRQPHALPALRAPGVQLPDQRRLGSARERHDRRRARGRQLRRARLTWADVHGPPVNFDLLDEGPGHRAGRGAPRRTPRSTGLSLAWRRSGELEATRRSGASGGARSPRRLEPRICPDHRRSARAGSGPPTGNGCRCSPVLRAADHQILHPDSPTEGQGLALPALRAARSIRGSSAFLEQHGRLVALMEGTEAWISTGSRSRRRLAVMTLQPRRTSNRIIVVHEQESFRAGPAGAPRSGGLSVA